MGVKLFVPTWSTFNKIPIGLSVITKPEYQALQEANQPAEI